MSKLGHDLVESVTNAIARARGKKTGAHATVVEVPDVRATRRRLHMSQQQFAATFGIPLATLKNWEQWRRQPDAAAAAYLQVIVKGPREIGEALKLTA
jgi:putative transcriptional regulator